MTASRDRQPVGVVPGEVHPLLDIAGAAAHLGVSEAFVRRLVLERRVRYFKVGKFVRFRPADLDAFVEAGRREPVQPWVHVRSTQRRTMAGPTVQPRSTGGSRAGERGSGTKG